MNEVIFSYFELMTNMGHWG